MVGRVNFTIRGGKEMESLLKEMGPKVARNLGGKALREAAKPIVQEAKRLVPVRTGKLKRSIVAVTGRSRSESERVVHIGFKPPASRRAHLTEFGTAHHAAQPFLRPALDSRSADALNKMVDVLVTGIEKQGWKVPDVAPDTIITE